MKLQEVDALLVERDRLPQEIRQAAMACDTDRIAKLEADRRVLPVRIARATLALAEEVFVAAQTEAARRSKSAGEARFALLAADKEAMPYVERVKAAAKVEQDARDAHAKAERTVADARAATGGEDRLVALALDDPEEFERVLRARLLKIRGALGDLGQA